MESLGKERDFRERSSIRGSRSTATRARPTSTRHVQQLRDGVPNFFATFIEVARTETARRFRSSPA
jgi:glucose-6-phosphate isomerase